MSDVANWVACLNRENGPGGTPSHEVLSVSCQGALEMSSVAGQPPSLIRNHFSTPTLVAESHKRDEKCRPSSQRAQYPTLYRRLKQRPGHSLRANLYKGSEVRQGKKAIQKCSTVKGCLFGSSKFQGPMSKPNCFGCIGQFSSGGLHKQRGNHSAEMCALLLKITTWCHHYQITLKARHISGCLNMVAGLLSRYNQVQSTEWSLHP